MCLSFINSEKNVHRLYGCFVKCSSDEQTIIVSGLSSNAIGIENLAFSYVYIDFDSEIILFSSKPLLTK